MASEQRIALWGAIGVVAVFTAISYSSVHRLHDEVAAQAAIIGQPAVVADVVPGIPADLSEAWRKAVAGDETPPAQARWVTVRLTNHGLGAADDVLADLAFAQKVTGVYALAHGGDVMEADSFGGPRLEAGGVGTNSARIQFDALPSRQSDLVFVALPPTGPIGVATGAAAMGADVRKVAVTASPQSRAGQKVTTVTYGAAPPSGPAVASPEAPTAPAGTPPKET